MCECGKRTFTARTNAQTIAAVDAIDVNLKQSQGIHLKRSEGMQQLSRYEAKPRPSRLR